MNKTETTKKNGSDSNYPLLDLIQYIASLFVILIHCGRLSEKDILHFTLKVFFGRLAVPIFLITAGYFFCLKQKASPSYARSYFKRQWKAYLFWSIAYLPYGIWFIHQLSLDPHLYPVALLVGLGYSGICYHLWYFPALFFGFFLVQKAIKHFSFPIVFSLCFIIFTIGAIETYSGYLQETTLYAIYAVYRKMFVTTRNGIFYTPIFILIGFYLATPSITKPRSEKQRWLCLVISAMFLGMESVIVCSRQGADKNFLFSLIPVSFFLMDLLIHSKRLTKMDFSHLRRAGHFLFFLHPTFLESTKWITGYLGERPLQGLPLFFVTFALTTLSLKLSILFRRRWTVRKEKNKIATS